MNALNWKLLLLLLLPFLPFILVIITFDAAVAVAVHYDYLLFMRKNVI